MPSPKSNLGESVSQLMDLRMAAWDWRCRELQGLQQNCVVLMPVFMTHLCHGFLSSSYNS